MAGLCALLLAMATALTGCSQESTLDGAAEVMKVEGVSVPMSELNFYLRYQQIQMQALYGGYFGEDFMNQDLMGTGAPYGETIRDSAAEALKEFYLVEAHAGELGVALEDQEKSEASEAAKAFLEANDSKTLEAMTADEATVSHVMELLTLQSKVFENRAATIDTEVPEEDVAQKRISYVMTSTVGTSDAEGNVTELSEEELAEKRTLLETILAEAKESGDLKAAAEAHELNAVSTTYGKNDAVLNDAVKDAADSLSNGEYSGLVEAESGYYIVYMENTYDEEATETARNNVLTQRENEAYAAWYQPIEEAAEISTNDELIASLTFERVFKAPAAEQE